MILSSRPFIVFQEKRKLYSLRSTILTAEEELASASSLFFLAACSRKALALFFLAGVVVGTPELSSCALLDL